MLFGGEERFHKDLKKTPSGIIYGNSFGDLTQTENHLGPGKIKKNLKSYFYSKLILY